MINTKKFWTAQRDEFLKANYGKSSSDMIARCLGCGAYDVELRKKQLSSFGRMVKK